MAEYDMGTARGRIRIEYDGDDVDRMNRDLEGARDNAESSEGRFKSFASTLTKVVAQAGLAGGAIAVVGATIGAAFISAGAALGAFQLAAGPQFAKAKESADLYTEAIEAQALGAEDAGEKMQAYKDHLATLSPATRETAVALVGLKSDFKAWSESLSGDTMPIFTRGIELLRAILPKLSPLVRVASAALGDFLTKIEGGVQGGGVDKFITKVTEMATKSVPMLLNSLRNIGVGIAGVVRAFLPMSDSMGGGIEELTAKFAAFGQSLSSNAGFQKFVEQMNTAGPGVTSTLGDIATIIGNLTQVFAPFSGALLIITSALAALVAAIPVPLLQAFATVVIAINVAMKAWAIAQGIATIATKAWAAAVQVAAAATRAWAAVQTAFNIVMAANPIGLAVIAIAALVAILVIAWKNSETFRRIVTETWEAVQEFVINAVKKIVDFVRNHWRLLITILGGPLGLAIALITKYWDQIFAFFRSIVTGIINFVKNNWQLILATILAGPVGLAIGLIVKHWDSIKAAFSSAVSGVINALKNAWNNIPAVIRAPLEAVLRYIPSFWSGFTNAIRNGVSRNIQQFRDMISTIRNFFSGAGSWLRDAGAAIIRGLIDGILAQVQYLRSLLDQVTGWIPDWKGPLKKDKKLLQPAGREIMRGFIGSLKKQIPQVKATLEGVTRQVATSGGSMSGPRDNPLVRQPAADITRRLPAPSSAPDSGSCDCKGNEYNFNTTVNNPVAETASDSVNRRVGTIARLGLLDGASSMSGG